MSATRIRITMDHGGFWDITARPEAVRAAGGLKSGVVVTLNQTVGDVQERQVWIKPYYRRTIAGELNIFAVQVTPKKEA